MDEKLKLKNGTEFDIPVNGVRERASTKSLLVEVIVPQEMDLEEVKSIFSEKAALEELSVVKNGATVIIFQGYVKLGSRLILDSHKAVGVLVSEDEDGTKETETQYAVVAELELFRATLEDLVEENRADIDYLLMMEE